MTGLTVVPVPGHGAEDVVVATHGPDEGACFTGTEDGSIWRVSHDLRRIDRVAACFYSHWHPDHVMGRRVFEPLNWEIRSWPYRVRHTDVYLPEQVAADFDTYLGGSEHLAYLEEVGVIRIHVVPDGQHVSIDSVTVTPFRLAERYVYAFLVEQAGTRVLIAPDELVGWSPPAWPSA